MTEKPIDHEKPIEWPYSVKPPSDELRKRLSKMMKDFNRKTGKITLTANREVARRRKAKGKP